jgi:hypothetical protein
LAKGDSGERGPRGGREGGEDKAKTRGPDLWEDTVKSFEESLSLGGLAREGTRLRVAPLILRIGL